MLESILSPYHDAGLLILRLALGITFVVHGWPKLNSGSPMGGTAGVAGFFKQMGIPLPALAAWVVALLETAGAALLALGLGTRILAALFAIEMVVAILVAKRGMMKIGFMAQQATGWELDFALLGGALTLLFTGAGNLALDPIMGL